MSRLCKTVSGLLKNIFVLCMIASGLSLTGCTTTQPLPGARESDHFHTLDSGFHIAAREGEIRYRVILEPKTRWNRPLFFTVHYDNPANPDEPHVERGEWRDEDGYIFLKSPPLSMLVSGEIYRVRLTLFSDQEQTHVIDEHEVLIFSNIDTQR